MIMYYVPIPARLRAGAHRHVRHFVEPKVMGLTFDIHPPVGLVVTALGGLLGGIVGLILAVPATVIAGNAIARLRAEGFVDQVADRRTQ